MNQTPTMSHEPIDHEALEAIRDGVRSLCQQYDGEYWRQIDEVQTPGRDADFGHPHVRLVGRGVFCG